MTAPMPPTRVRAGRRGRLALAWAASAVVVGLVVFAPRLLWDVDPNAVDPAAALLPPGPGAPLGTDESGRDVLSRVLAGAAPSLGIGLAATAIGLAAGVALGVVGATTGRIGRVLSARVIEVAFAFPALLLALLVIVVTGPGPVPTTVAVGLAAAPGFARIVRERILTVRASAYVESDVLLGRSRAATLATTVLPNALWPILAVATLGIGQAIVWASALSYLGLGAQPPAAEWGAMLSAGRTYLQAAPWLTIAPGGAILIVAVAATMLGRATRSGGAR